VSVGDLLEPAEPAPVHIVRGDGSADLEAGRRGLDRVALDGELDVSLLSLPRRGVERLEPRPAGSRLLVYVLQGKPIAGPVERPSELAAGDYASFPADVPHLIEAGARPVRLLLGDAVPLSQRARGSFWAGVSGAST
jgi:hypothetical protein